MKDSNGNEVSTTLYESYLSKAIIEAKELYTEIFIKIAEKISQTIKLNNQFSRSIFTLFSQVNLEFPSYDNIDKFLEPGFNLHAAALLHKLFFDFLLKDLATPSLLPTKDTTLFALTQRAIAENKTLHEKLSNKLDPENIFSDKKSGRIEKTINHPTETRKLGITTEENANEEIRSYFFQPYVPGQILYQRDTDSLAARWLAHYHLAFVSGISSTIGTAYCGIIRLGIFSREEVSTYLMAIAGSLVSRGHHSFGEMHPVLKKIGYPIEEKYEACAYYKQFLTKDFIESKHYANYLEEVQKLGLEKKHFNP